MTAILNAHSTSNMYPQIYQKIQNMHTYVLIISSNRVHMYPSARIRVAIPVFFLRVERVTVDIVCLICHQVGQIGRASCRERVYVLV